MNESYVEVVLDLAADSAMGELLSSQLYELGFSGFLEDDAGLHCYIPKNLWSSHVETNLSSIVKKHGLPATAISAISEIQQQNWNQQWEASIQPVAVTEKIIIAPSWHTLSNADGKVVLVIDPKMSFGTGYHESTRLMLRMMERAMRPHSFVLDVGTGTGILAIAAVKLGARFAVGVDVDEWSYINAKENTNRNGCEQNVEVRLGSLDAVPERGFDFILANITRNTISELFPAMVKKIDSNGIFLLSGLLVDDRDPIKKVLSDHGYSILFIESENEWIGIGARKQLL
jgi:ribosomal protein L11 methyltransferase